MTNATIIRATRDEIMEGQQGRYYGFSLTLKRQGGESNFKILSVDQDNMTGYAVSYSTKQIVRFRDIGILPRNGVRTVAIDTALDTGDTAGTLWFGQDRECRGTVNARLFTF